LILAGLGLVSVWLTAWISACLVAAMCLDARSWKRKVVLGAIPSQAFLYAQVFAHAFWDALPWYVFAYVVYVCVAPLWEWTNLAISSFVMLYGFYMLIRAWWLVRCLWLLNFRWGEAGQTFAVQEANLRSRSEAIRHVLWAYFLGNVGVVIRCASQVLTLSLFEWLRTATAMDLRTYPSLNAHLLPIGITVGAVWLGTFWLAVRRALLIYYRTHRTFHHCLPLYDSVHSIHHRGVLPTPLDSGTISPAEFIIMEMALPAGMLVPNWWWTGAQIILGFAGHWPSHDAGTKMEFSQHHLQHHRRFNVNFGLTPSEDARFGTLYTASKGSGYCSMSG
jgi:sterol desaturase/sphingolipid hydroxylase (fatty acid hydroxylase superfamily)